jgi:hypothetical protein
MTPICAWATTCNRHRRDIMREEAMSPSSGALSRGPSALLPSPKPWDQLRTVMQEMSERFKVRHTASA